MRGVYGGLDFPDETECERVDCAVYPLLGSSTAYTFSGFVAVWMLLSGDFRHSWLAIFNDMHRRLCTGTMAPSVRTGQVDAFSLQGLSCISRQAVGEVGEFYKEYCAGTSVCQ
jgi:hypothetical protein